MVLVKVKQHFISSHMRLSKRDKKSWRFTDVRKHHIIHHSCKSKLCTLVSHSNVWTLELAFCASAVKWHLKKHCTSLLKIVSCGKTCISVSAVQRWRQELFAVCCMDAPSCLHLRASEVPIALQCPPHWRQLRLCVTKCVLLVHETNTVMRRVPLQPQCLTNYFPFIITSTEERHK